MGLHLLENVSNLGLNSRTHEECQSWKSGLLPSQGDVSLGGLDYFFLGEISVFAEVNDSLFYREMSARADWITL